MLNLKILVVGAVVAMTATSTLAFTEIDPEQRFVPDESPGTALVWSVHDRGKTTAFWEYMEALHKRLGRKDISVNDLIATTCARPENKGKCTPAPQQELAANGKVKTTWTISGVGEYPTFVLPVDLATGAELQEGDVISEFEALQIFVTDEIGRLEAEITTITSDPNKVGGDGVADLAARISALESILRADENVVEESPWQQLEGLKQSLSQLREEHEGLQSSLTATVAHLNDLDQEVGDIVATGGTIDRRIKKWATTALREGGDLHHLVYDGRTVYGPADLEEGGAISLAIAMMVEAELSDEGVIALYVKDELAGFLTEADLEDDGKISDLLVQKFAGFLNSKPFKLAVADIADKRADSAIAASVEDDGVVAKAVKTAVSDMKTTYDEQNNAWRTGFEQRLAETEAKVETIAASRDGEDEVGVVPPGAGEIDPGDQARTTPELQDEPPAAGDESASADNLGAAGDSSPTVFEQRLASIWGWLSKNWWIALVIAGWTLFILWAARAWRSRGEKSADDSTSPGESEKEASGESSKSTPTVAAATAKQSVDNDDEAKAESSESEDQHADIRADIRRALDAFDDQQSAIDAQQRSIGALSHAVIGDEESGEPGLLKRVGRLEDRADEVETELRELREDVDTSSVSAGNGIDWERAELTDLHKVTHGTTTWTIPYFENGEECVAEVKFTRDGDVFRTNLPRPGQPGKVCDPIRKLGTNSVKAKLRQAFKNRTLQQLGQPVSRKDAA